MRTLERVERNVDFRWPSAPRLGGVVDSEQAEAWDRDGFLLVKDALDPATVAAVRDAIDSEEEAFAASLRQGGAKAGDINAADQITFTTHLVTRSAVVRAFAASPPFARLAADLVGPDVRLYWDQAVYKKPEPARDFPWHQDTGYTYNEPQHYLTCWVPLVDATVDNGCPWVLPGLHVEGTLKHRWTEQGWRCIDDAPDAVAVEAEVGDVVCFSSLTPHRTGPNMTDGVRKAYILQFAADPTVCFHRGRDEPVPQVDPVRQFFVVRGGRPLSGAEA